MLQHLWTGQWPKNRAPTITPMRLNDQTAADNVYLEPEAKCTAQVIAEDPEGDRITFQWEILPADPKESRWTKKGAIALPDATGAKVQFTAPKAEGAYRLFVYVRDGQGNVATANLPFMVRAAGAETGQSR